MAWRVVIVAEIFHGGLLWPDHPPFKSYWHSLKNRLHVSSEILLGSNFVSGDIFKTFKNNFKIC